MFGDQFMLSLTMYREAANQGTEGLIAVGSVIKNRVQAQKSSYYKICTAPNQFSSNTIKGDPMTVKWPDGNDQLWLSIQDLANRIMNGIIADNTGGALFYYNPVTATSGWFIDNIVNSPAHPFTVQIGAHRFYK